MENGDCFTTVKLLRLSSEVKNCFENCKIRNSTERESGKIFEMLCKFKTRHQHVQQMRRQVPRLGVSRGTWQQIEAQTFGSHQAKAFPWDLTEDCSSQRIHVSHFPENRIQFIVPFVVPIFMQYRPSTDYSFLPIDLELLFCLLSSLLNTSPIRFVPLSFYFPNWTKYSFLA